MNGGEWVLPGAAALLIGISKTSVGGLAAIAVAVFASVMPAKESTAAVLLLLLTGDVVAVARYRRGADWGLLRRLLPSVVPGLALGAVFLWFVSDTVVRRSIGGLIAVMVIVQLWQRRRGGMTAAAGGGGSGADADSASGAGGIPLVSLALASRSAEADSFVTEHTGDPWTDPVAASFTDPADELSEKVH